MADDRQDFATVIGPDAKITGEIAFEKAMRIHGQVEGKITTAGRVHVAREAKVHAEISAAAVVVEGEVKGNLTASDRIELKQSARYEGDLRASKLVVEEGANFSGHVAVGPEAVKQQPTAPAAPRVSVSVTPPAQLHAVR
jgi:cytoskeletal protein CcmA (bactofilin family)